MITFMGEKTTRCTNSAQPLKAISQEWFSFLCHVQGGSRSPSPSWSSWTHLASSRVWHEGPPCFHTSKPCSPTAPSIKIADVGGGLVDLGMGVSPVSWPEENPFPFLTLGWNLRISVSFPLCKRLLSSPFSSFFPLKL